MKPLDPAFTKSGWQFQQLRREGNTALFQRWKPEGLPPHYEVVRIRSHNGFKIPGTDKISDPAEYYPGDTAWGRDGFTFVSMETAITKFDTLRGLENKNTEDEWI